MIVFVIAFVVAFVKSFVIGLVIAFVIVFVIAFVNFGPDQLHYSIHFKIRSTFDLCLYMHRSTLV